MVKKVSIGIPTYNRPSGLKRTLERIVAQTYPHLEIIVSDNCSQGTETQDVVRSFMKDDLRVKYYRQEVNKGLIYNFQFVFSQATQNYFMWATDDDYFESLDLVEKLVNESEGNILTFANYNFISDQSTHFNYFTPIYNFCKTRTDYINSFCSNGLGHPSCGMFNLDLLKRAGIELKVQSDLSYHMEGILLHTIFNTGKVKYVDSALINYSTYSRASSSIIPKERVRDFLIYTQRVLLFYIFNARNTAKDKARFLRATITLHYNYFISQLGGKRYSSHRFSVAMFIFKAMISF